MHQGAHGAQAGMVQGARPPPVVSGGVRIKLEPSSLLAGSGLRVLRPEPEWGGASVK